MAYSKHKTSDIVIGQIPGLIKPPATPQVPDDEISKDTIDKATLREIQKQRDERRRDEQRPALRIEQTVDDYNRSRYEEWKRSQENPQPTRGGFEIHRGPRDRNDFD